MAQFYVSEGKFDSLKKRMLAMLTRAGGTMDRASLLKNMHVDVETFKKIIKTLHMCNMIEEEFISAKTTSYTLKDVA